MSELGRPLQIKTPEEFEAMANAFFAQCVADDKRPTVNGLVLALGMTSRQSLHNYEDRPDFVDVIKRARTRIEVEWEQALSGNNVAGSIFWLKNQGWSDRMETSLTGANGGPIETINKVERVIVRPANRDS